MDVPVKALRNDRCPPGKLAASKGVAAVAADHRVTPEGNTFRPPSLDTT